MRLPTIAKNSARDSDDEIDQEMVNRLTDYAIEHGVNYFDNSPAYCKGRSEHAMGIALSLENKIRISMIKRYYRQNFSRLEDKRIVSGDVYKRQITRYYLNIIMLTNIIF